jgi:hypothetical protein
MAAIAWGELADELARRKPVFWLRDDDAVAATPALERLLLLTSKNRVPLALAVVPDRAESGLFETLRGEISVLQHGCDHRNRAGPGEKKTEFPAREALQAALDRLRRAHERLVSMGGSRVLPVVAPPWNRLRRELAAALPRIGIKGLSGYGDQAPLPDLVQCNTHVDVVAWRDGKRFIGETEAARLALTYARKGGPVGWLTHHAVHDAATWRFLERLFALPGPRWTSAVELFSYTRPAHG